MLFASAAVNDVHGDQSLSTPTRVVMLGTGNPNPNPARSGPATAIVVDERVYLVDFGAGVMRRAAALTPLHGGKIEALEARRFNRAFLTHLHSDHTIGLPDLILTPWVMGRSEPLVLYGPEGISGMAEATLNAYKADITYRVQGAENANDTGWRVEAKTARQGTIYTDDYVSVDAFNVSHGSWENAFGYRFTTDDRVIVISGDTAPNSNIENFSRGTNILIHSTYSSSGVASSPPQWQAYMRQNHTSSLELGELAKRVQPDLLVLHHVLFMGATEDQILAEVGKAFDGRVIIANDLDIF